MVFSQNFSNSKAMANLILGITVEAAACVRNAGQPVNWTVLDGPGQ